MRYFLLLFCLIFSYNSFAQQCSNDDCPCFMRAGDNYAKKKNYKKAVLNYLIARDCDKKYYTTVEQKLVSLFSKIDNQRKKAENSEKNIAKVLEQVQQEKAKTQ
ncbi:MAG: hypothetical protein GY810_06900, partial [Aureispira sp.]|nr:hypothetical protein [Aureispira sp.]